MSESSRRKKLALAGISEPIEEVEKRKAAYEHHKAMSKGYRKAHRFIRGKFNPLTKEVTQ